MNCKCLELSQAIHYCFKWKHRNKQKLIYCCKNILQIVVNRSSKSQIAMSQKGVFVNNYSSTSLDFLIGDINLKKKIKINIDRNQFSNEDQVLNFISRFEVRILENIFIALEKKYKSQENALQITDDFLKNYYRRLILIQFMKDQLIMNTKTYGKSICILRFFKTANPL